MNNSIGMIAGILPRLSHTKSGISMDHWVSLKRRRVERAVSMKQCRLEADQRQKEQMRSELKQICFTSFAPSQISFHWSEVREGIEERRTARCPAWFCASVYKKSCIKKETRVQLRKKKKWTGCKKYRE